MNLLFEPAGQSVRGPRAVTPLLFGPAERVEPTPEPAVDAQREAEERAGELRKLVDAARAEAEARAAGEYAVRLELALAGERERVAGFCAEQVRLRAAFFAALEEAAVRLATRMAAHLLEREWLADGCALLPAVRAALAPVAGQEGVALAVPAGEEANWRRALGETAGLTVTGVASLGPGQCVLEAGMGRVEWDLAAQLAGLETALRAALATTGQLA